MLGVREDVYDGNKKGRCLGYQQRKVYAKVLCEDDDKKKLLEYAGKKIKIKKKKGNCATINAYFFLVFLNFSSCLFFIILQVIYFIFSFQFSYVV